MINPKKMLKFFASLKLAVISISLIAVVTAVGTIVESEYNAEVAKKLVYDSPWMTLIMGLFALNLTSVMVDRWPWKKQHTPFVLAHIGILVMMAGFVMTSRWGIDGSMRVGIGEKNNLVTIAATDIIVYSSFDGTNYTKIFEHEVDFFRKQPMISQPFEIPGDQVKIQIIDYKPFVLPERKILPSKNERLGAGIRFQISNDRVNEVQWLVQRNSMARDTHDMGPARIHLGPAPAAGQLANEIYLTPEPGTSKIKYTLFRRDQIDPFKKGFLEEGGSVDTGWMGLQLKILRYYPYAQQEWDIKVKDRPTPLTTEAIRVKFKDQEQWVLLNDTLKLFSENAAYFLSYVNRRIDLGFHIELKDFLIEHYPGTTRAASYKSKVYIKDLGDKEIYMNHPLDHKGFLIYQASFQEGPTGTPVASVFSINFDPGRWIKYLGSLITVFGIIALFYFRKKKVST